MSFLFMILSEYTIVNISNKNKKYFRELGYNIDDKQIKVSINDLSKGSHAIIIVKCDICDKEKDIMFKQYLRGSKYGYYTCCPKCSWLKNKITNLKKYGVKNYSETEECKSKIKKTNLERYGSKSYLQTDDYKKKTKITNLKKYGVESHNSSDIIKENKKQTMLEKYGVENPSQLKEIKKKKKDTLIKNGYIATSENINDFYKYRLVINRITRRKKKNYI